MDDAASYDTDETEVVLDALHLSLTQDLTALEAKIHALEHTVTVKQQDRWQLDEYCRARAGLHSGLASIAEVLGWIRWKTEEEPHGDNPLFIERFPAVSRYLIH